MREKRETDWGKCFLSDGTEKVISVIAAREKSRGLFSVLLSLFAFHLCNARLIFHFHSAERERKVPSLLYIPVTSNFGDFFPLEKGREDT